MHLVRSGAVAGFGALVKQLGGNAIELIREAGLSESQFRNPNSYISYTKMALLLEMCADRCASPFFGFLLAQKNIPGVLGDLPATVSQEPTLGQALTELDKHIYLVANGVRVTQIAKGGNTQLVMSFDFESPLGLNQLLQLSVGHLVNIVSRLMGVDRYTLPLHLTQVSSPIQHELKHGFYPQTQFSSSFNGVTLPSSALAKKTHIDEAAIQLHFRERLAHLQKRYPDNLQDQVRALIGQLLVSGDCSIEKVAANLDMHPRMLQIKLKQERTNYRSLLSQTRQTIAEQHLAKGFISVTDLALNLGFTDVAVFSRSFKAWTGVPPTMWREIQKGLNSFD